MNYSLVINPAIFKPYDYDLAWRAIDAYNAGYEKSLAVYDKIAQTLGDLSSAVEGSTRAKRIYDEYQNRFNVAADNFNRGMNQKTAAELGELRKLYGTLIRLLERANEAMVKEAERRRAAKPEMNMLYLDIGTLDDYMENPNRVLGSYSGTLLSAEVNAMVKNIADSMVKLDNAGRLDKYNKIWLKTKGFSAENINKAIAEVLQGGIANVKDDVMRGILQSAMLSSGIYNWADDATRRNAEIIASRGLYGGIGQSEMGTYKDYANEKALEHKYHELEADAALARALDLLKAKNELNLNNLLGGTYGRSYLEEVEGNGKTKYQNLLTSIQSLIGEDGKLKQLYRAAEGKLGDPMKIYEDYHKYLEGHKRIPEPGDKAYFTSLYQAQYGGSPSLYDYEGAMKYIKLKYGVASVITKEQYDTMKSLGYDGSEFTMNHGGYTNYDMTDYMDKLNNLASRKTSSYASGEKITLAIANRIGKGLVHYKSNNALKEVNGQLKPVSKSDWDDVKAEDIGEVGIDIGAEKVVFVMKDGTKYVVDPNIISTNFQDKWETGIQLKQQIEDSDYTNAQKARALYELQETVLTWLMKECGRDIFQVKGETSNNE